MMTHEAEFAMAVVMCEDGWEFRGLAENGEMIFTRAIAGVVFAANVRVDR